MSELVNTSKLADFVDQDVVVKGWVYNLRSSGKLVFLQIRDGAGFTQAIVSESEVSNDIWEKASKLTVESSVEVSGTVSKHPKKDEYEIQVKDIIVVQASEEYPIGAKEHGPDFLLDKRHLWLRSQTQWAVQKIRHTVIFALQEYLNNQGFTKFDSPILTPTACEGTTTLFELDYFDEGSAFLTQSGQLYLEAGAMALGKVYDFGPVFRAEKSKTRRHLTEFWMLDAEVAYASHEENMDLQEAQISYVVEKVLENCKDELEILERDVEKLSKVKAPFLRLSYADTIKKLQELGSDIKDGEDLGGDDETLLTENSDVPVFVERWPAEIKAFYMKRDPENEGLALCSDLIAPEGFGEIAGGSAREEDINVIEQRMKDHDLPVDEYQWYLDLRRYGSVPHAGYGIGLERLVGWMCGRKHVRETIPFPRLINRNRP